MKAPSNDANRPNANAPGKGGDKASGTGADAAKPGTIGQSVQGAKPDPTKPDPPKQEPVKPEAKDAPRTEVKPAGPASTQPGKPGAVPVGGTAPGVVKATAEPPKPATSPVEPARPGTPAGSAPGIGVPRSEPAKAATAGSGPTAPGTIRSEPGKPGEAKLADAKTADAKPGDAKSAATDPGDAKPGTGKAEPFRAGGNVTDGPILDLKAKRVPDTAEPPKGATAAAGAKAEPGKDAPKDGPKPASAASPIPKASAAPEPARGGAGFGSMAAAGLIGGVISAGLLFGADRAGVLPAREDGRVAALEQRIAGLAPRDALAALDKRVAGNEAALKPLPEAVKAAEATAKQALAQAGQPGSAPAEAAQGAAPSLPADLVARLDSLDQRVSALQEEPGRDAQAEGQAAVQAAPNLGGLPDRVKALEDKAAAPQQGLDQRLAALQADVESRTTANAEADRTLGQRLDTLQQALDERVKSATEAVEKATQASQQAAEAGRTQAQETTRALERVQQEQSEKIAALDKALGQRAEAATVQAALRVVTADRVATALATGAPYAEPLATLRKLETGDTARLDALAPFAEAGAPSTAQLAAEFRPVAEKAVAARRAAEARSVAESGDIKTKLLSMADSIVQVRRVDAPPASTGKPAGEDPVAKVQAALDRGALQDAVTAFDALPQEAKAEAGAFGEKLKARNAAAQAARGLLSDAFKNLPVGP